MLKATEEGVAALNKMADDLRNKIEEIRNTNRELQQAFDEHGGRTAPHSDGLENVIESVERTSDKAAGPVEGLADSVEDYAKDMEDWITEGDPYAGVAGN